MLAIYYFKKMRQYIDNIALEGYKGTDEIVFLLSTEQFNFNRFFSTDISDVTNASTLLLIVLSLILL
jgi:hypothetical protein